MLRHYQEIMPLFPSFTFVKQLFTKHPAGLRHLGNPDWIICHILWSEKVPTSYPETRIMTCLCKMSFHGNQTQGLGSNYSSCVFLAGWRNLIIVWSCIQVTTDSDILLTFWSIFLARNSEAHFLYFTWPFRIHLVLFLLDYNYNPPYFAGSVVILVYKLALKHT